MGRALRGGDGRRRPPALGANHEEVADVRYTRDVTHGSGAARPSGDQGPPAPQVLANEIGRAAESVALNASEARQRAGIDRADLFQRAAGSESELTTALRIARARLHHTRGLRGG